MAAALNSPVIENASALLRGEILLKTRPHSAWGGAVTAQMYLPIGRSQVWQHVTDYACWTQYFIDITHSEVVHPGIAGVKTQVKRLYQKASKAFLFINAHVEIYLKILETTQQRVQFFMESGSFHDFTADLILTPYGEGTVLTYSVQATPNVPIPGIFIEQAIQWDLPANLRQMREVILQRSVLT